MLKVILTGNLVWGFGGIIHLASVMTLVPVPGEDYHMDLDPVINSIIAIGNPWH